MAKRDQQQANLSPIGSNDKKQKIIDEISQIGTLSKAVIDNPDTPDFAKTIIQQLSAMLTATAQILQNQQQQQISSDPHEMERQRSVVLIGVPESTKERSTERAKEDNGTVLALLDKLDVEVMPQAVYRMGRRDENRRGGRLIKVVFPARTFQWRTLGQWKRRRETIRNEDPFKRLLVRPSLTFDQLNEERMKRQQRALSTNDQVPITNQNF